MTRKGIVKEQGKRTQILPYHCPRQLFLRLKIPNCRKLRFFNSRKGAIFAGLCGVYYK
jgi:hypothetical protein